MPRKTTANGRIYWEARSASGKFLGRARLRHVAELLEKLDRESIPAEPEKHQATQGRAS